jgi:hypothetical protein
VEINELERTLIGDGLRRLRTGEDPNPGDVIVYRSAHGIATHAGIVVQMDVIGDARVVRVLSKWGQEAEYLHPRDVVPAQFGTPSEYWTDRHDN